MTLARQVADAIAVARDQDRRTPRETLALYGLSWHGRDNAPGWDDVAAALTEMFGRDEPRAEDLDWHERRVKRR